MEIREYETNEVVGHFSSKVVALTLELLAKLNYAGRNPIFSYSLLKGSNRPSIYPEARPQGIHVHAYQRGHESPSTSLLNSALAPTRPVVGRYSAIRLALRVDWRFSTLRRHKVGVEAVGQGHRSG